MSDDEDIVLNIVSTSHVKKPSNSVKSNAKLNNNSKNFPSHEEYDPITTNELDEYLTKKNDLIKKDDVTKKNEVIKKTDVNKKSGVIKKTDLIKKKISANPVTNTKPIKSTNEIKVAVTENATSEIKPISKENESDVKLVENNEKVSSMTKKDKLSAENELKSNIAKAAKAKASSHLANIMSEQVEANIGKVFSTSDWKTAENKYNIHPHLISCILTKFNHIKMTMVQNISMPHLVERKNVLIKAQTGSGKTLAYGVPLLNDLMKIEPPVSRTNGPLAFIVLPTRELAAQTYEVFAKLVYSCVRIVPCLFQGGQKRKSEKTSLRKGVNIVIGTPKRILDHLVHTKAITCASLRWLIIDEADRLVEMNFEQDVKMIIEKIRDLEYGSPSDLNTVLLSATLNKGVEELAGMALTDPVRCEVKENNNTIENPSDYVMPDGLKHFLLITPTKQKLIALASFVLLKCRYNSRGGKVIVFFSTQNCVDFYFKLFHETLCSHDEDLVMPASAAYLHMYKLHGNMEHKDRVQVFQEFSNSHSGVLMTTDVASRGLDLAGVSWVVQYQISGGVVDYIHRVGRTARAGGKGKALLMLQPEENGYADLLTHRVGLNMTELNLDEVLGVCLHHIQNLKKIAGERRNSPCKTVEEAVSRLSFILNYCVENNAELLKEAQKAYLSFLRSYASLSGEMREFFFFKRLHLGHVAKSFCLRESPKNIAGKVTGKSFAMRGKRGAKRMNHQGQSNNRFSKFGGKDKLAMKERSKVNNKRSINKAFELNPEKNKGPVFKKRRIAPSQVAKHNMLNEFAA